MSLAHGRPYLAIPGPSVVPDAVLRAMHRASPNIYEGELIEMTAGIIPDLRRVRRSEITNLRKSSDAISPTRAKVAR